MGIVPVYPSPFLVIQHCCEAKEPLQALLATASSVHVRNEVQTESYSDIVLRQSNKRRGEGNERVCVRHAAFRGSIDSSCNKPGRIHIKGGICKHDTSYRLLSTTAKHFKAFTCTILRAKSNENFRVAAVTPPIANMHHEPLSLGEDLDSTTLDPRHHLHQTGLVLP